MSSVYNKLSRTEQEKVRESAKKMGAAYTEGMGGSMQANDVEILGHSCDKGRADDKYFQHPQVIIAEQMMKGLQGKAVE